MSTLVTPALVRSLADSLGDGAVFGAAEGGWFIPAWTVETGSYVPARGSSLQSTTPGSGGYYILLAGEVGGLCGFAPGRKKISWAMRRYHDGALGADLDQKPKSSSSGTC